LNSNQDALSPNKQFVLGSRPSLTLEVNVTNYGEPSYGTQVELRLPLNATLRRAGGCSEMFDPLSYGRRQAQLTYRCPLSPDPLAFKRTVCRRQSAGIMG